MGCGGMPMGCRVQHSSLEPGFGSEGESCVVCDLSRLVRVHLNVGWRGRGE